MPATESAHALGLDTGHPEEVLRVGEVVGELGELLVQLRLDENMESARVSGRRIQCKTPILK